MGPIQIEFIEQINDGPSPYRDFVTQGHRGMHHFGLLVDDLDGQLATLAERGKEAVYRGSTPQGFRLAYLADDVHPGGMIELG